MNRKENNNGNGDELLLYVSRIRNERQRVR